jgi:hypothetical protein
MNIKLARLAAALTTATIVTVGFAGAASATTTTETSDPTTESTIVMPNRLDVAKARCTAAIDKRLRHIEVLKGRLTNPAVTDAHRRSLTDTLNEAARGLTNLKAPIAAAPDKATLRPLCNSIVVDFRIYLLRTPQVNRVIGLDVAQSALARLANLSADLQSQIDAKKAAGEDTGRAEEALARMNTQIREGHGSSDGVADRVVEFDVADWNANHDLLAPAGQAVRETHRHIVGARAFGLATQRILNHLS